MSELWLGRRFQRNERGSYAAWGKAGGARVAVEIAPELLGLYGADPETLLAKSHASIQRASRAKWARGEATQVAHSFSGRFDHYLITLTTLDV